MKERILKAFDFVAEGFWNEIFMPMVRMFLIIALVVFVVVGGMLLVAMLGIADYETMRNGLLLSTQKPWW